LDPDAETAIAAMGDVSSAYRGAFALGKPVLVLVIPEDKTAKWRRGEVLGTLLTHGGTGVLLDLSLCEVVCSTVENVRKELRGVEIDGEPLMLLVETAGPRATPIDPPVQYDIPEPRLGEGRFEEVDRLLQKRLDDVAAALHAAVAPTRDATAARAALAEKRLGPAEANALRATIAGGRLPESLDRAAAIARQIAEDPSAPNPHVLDALAAAAAARVKTKPPTGARWATDSGCHIRIEGERPRIGSMCGMGYVPRLSGRFLWFFTHGPG
jgi:hypothetical protein